MLAAASEARGELLAARPTASRGLPRRDGPAASGLKAGRIGVASTVLSVLAVSACGEERAPVSLGATQSTLSAGVLSTSAPVMSASAALPGPAAPIEKRTEGRRAEPCNPTEDRAADLFEGLSFDQRWAVNCFLDRLSSFRANEIHLETICDRRRSEVSCCVPYQVSKEDDQGYFIIATLDLDLGPSRAVMRISRDARHARDWSLAPTDLASMRECGCARFVPLRAPRSPLAHAARPFVNVAEWLHARRPYVPDYGLSNMLRWDAGLGRPKCCVRFGGVNCAKQTWLPENW